MPLYEPATSHTGGSAADRDLGRLARGCSGARQPCRGQGCSADPPGVPRLALVGSGPLAAASRQAGRVLTVAFVAKRPRPPRGCASLVARLSENDQPLGQRPRCNASSAILRRSSHRGRVGASHHSHNLGSRAIFRQPLAVAVVHAGLRDRISSRQRHARFPCVAGVRVGATAPSRLYSLPVGCRRAEFRRS